MTISVTKVRYESEWFECKEYIPFADLQGNVWDFKAFCIHEITFDIDKVNAKEVAEILVVNWQCDC